MNNRNHTNNTDQQDLSMPCIIFFCNASCSRFTSKCQSLLQDWMPVSRLPLTWGDLSCVLTSALKVWCPHVLAECSLVHRPSGSFCWNSNWGNREAALFMEIIWSHSSLCNMETTCSWISKAMTAAEGHIFFQYHCFEGGETSPLWALLDHWFDSEPARKVCKSKGISEWFVSYFVNKVQIIKTKFPSVSNHFSLHLIPFQ